MRVVLFCITAWFLGKSSLAAYVLTKEVADAECKDPTTNAFNEKLANDMIRSSIKGAGFELDSFRSPRMLKVCCYPMEQARMDRLIAEGIFYKRQGYNCVECTFSTFDND